jgi:hypothetical protein
MKNPLATLFDQFLKERTYLKNVTPATIIWYQVAFKNYCTSFPGDAPPMPSMLCRCGCPNARAAVESRAPSHGRY